MGDQWRAWGVDPTEAILFKAAYDMSRKRQGQGRKDHLREQEGKHPGSGGGAAARADGRGAGIPDVELLEAGGTGAVRNA